MRLPACQRHVSARLSFASSRWVRRAGGGGTGPPSTSIRTAEEVSTVCRSIKTPHFPTSKSLRLLGFRLVRWHEIREPLISREPCVIVSRNRKISPRSRLNSMSDPSPGIRTEVSRKQLEHLTKPVTFRVSPTAFDRLQAAAELEGLRPSSFVRKCVFRALHEHATGRAAW